MGVIMETLKIISTYKEQITTGAQEKLTQATSEALDRINCGLANAGTETLSPKAEVRRYLESIKSNFPEIDRYTDEMLRQIDDVNLVGVETIIAIPVVGFGDQEQPSIQRTLDVLAQQTLVATGNAAIVLYVNRPFGVEADNTVQVIKEWKTKNPNIRIAVFEGEIDPSMGRSSSPYYEGMEISTNSVPIALLRDILNIVAMKLWKSGDQRDSTLPTILQGDADLWRFTGTDEIARVQYILQSDPYAQFVQCTTDWDGPTATRSLPAMWLGSELMRELPLILKGLLNTGMDQSLRIQLIFGETIQRGIQVPQAERMESIARKGGYGLLRIPEDELDVNMRMTALFSGANTIRSALEIVFYYSNRRALAAWIKKQQPPIKQWSVEFVGVDAVRTADFTNIESPNGNLLDQAIIVANRTLARFPIPSWKFAFFEAQVIEVLKRYGLGRDAVAFQIVEGQNRDEVLIQISEIKNLTTLEQILINL